jgi:4-oxalocrotonate tautomerase
LDWCPDRVAPAPRGDLCSIEGDNRRGVTWVKISEVGSGEWGIGGQPPTTKAVKDLAASRHAA